MPRLTRTRSTVGDAKVTMMGSLSVDDAESRLVSAASRGDREAFIRLVAGHDSGLRSLAFRLLDDPDEMDDVLQDVYAKVFINLSSFRREAAVGTWLYRITYTTCIDRLRRRRREAAAHTALADTPSMAGPDPAELIIARDGLARALAELPPENRAAVLLIDREGFDYATAAQVLGVPAGTVASRVHSARAALRTALRQTRTEGTDD
jgi:RNA polymerase sigma-70 factor, ECF subfamily